MSRLKPQWYWHRQRAYRYRNWDIYFERRAGATYKALGCKYGITGTRVAQIYRKRQRVVNKNLWSAGCDIAVIFERRMWITGEGYEVTTA